MTMTEMKSYIKAKGLEKMVAELNQDGDNFEGAVEWVYDMHTMRRDDFRSKYFN